MCSKAVLCIFIFLSMSFLIIKANYKNDRKLWEYQNLECFYQLYRFANVNNFSYKKENTIRKKTFIQCKIASFCNYFRKIAPKVPTQKLVENQFQVLGESQGGWNPPLSINLLRSGRTVRCLSLRNRLRTRRCPYTSR